MLTTSKDRRLLLKTNNTNPDLCAVVSCYVQAVKERLRENRELKLRRRGRQRERQKSNRFD